jgi:alkaline phosphatase D
VVSFRHGVASGDPLADRVVLWTRVSGAAHPVAVDWVVGRSPDLGRPLRRGRVEARPEADFTVHVDADGLEPGCTYWYGFHAGEARSPVGRTRTTPAGSVARLRLGVTCCAHYGAGWFNVYGRLAERSLDAVVHLGDYFYEDEPRRSERRRTHRPPGRITTLAGYRTRYAQYRTDGDLQALHAAHPVVAVWDDHELAGNAWRDGAARHDPAQDGDWPARRAAATRAYLEWMPVRLPDPSDPCRLYRRVSFGDLADLVLLDTRLEGRDRPAAGRRAVMGIHRRDRRLLGAGQWAWLREAWRAVPAPRWRLLGSQVVVSPVHALRLADRLVPFARLLGATGGGVGVNPGGWDGYPEQRRDLLEVVGGGDTVILSGDLHSAWAAEVSRPVEDRGDPVAVEFSAPAVSALTFARALAPPGTAGLVERLFAAQNPHVRFVDLRHHGYVVVDVTAGRVQADFWRVRTVRHPSRSERWSGGWRVEAGSHRLRRADRPAG